MSNDKPLSWRNDEKVVVTDEQHYIKIGGIKYTFSITKDLGETEAGETLGNISYRDASIEIKDGLNQQIRGVTVLHEIIHGVLAHSGVEDHDENMIDLLSYGLHQVFTDNKWVLGVITNE